LSLIKEIQRHPLKRSLTHLDLIIVRKGEKVEVEIPVVLTGEPIAPAAAFADLQTLTLLVDALNVPEQVEVDVEGSEDGFQVFAGDVTLPEGSELASGVALPRIDETEDEEGEESEASAEPAEADEDSAEEE